MAETRLRLTGPRDRVPMAFDIRPDAAACASIAAELGLSSLRKLRFHGEVAPLGGRDWRLDGVLGATMVQPCGITLEPVTTRVDEPVARRYLAGYDGEVTALEQEMPEDTEDEPLPETLDLEAVMMEALTLAVPAFPRAEGAEMGDIAARPDGADPIEETEMKPFAGLKDALKDAKS